jgi:hypothetical protein
MQPDRPTVATVSAASRSPSFLDKPAIFHPIFCATFFAGPFVESLARPVLWGELHFAG